MSGWTRRLQRAQPCRWWWRRNTWQRRCTAASSRRWGPGTGVITFCFHARWTVVPAGAGGAGVGGSRGTSGAAAGRSPSTNSPVPPPSALRASALYVHTSPMRLPLPAPPAAAGAAAVRHRRPRRARPHDVCLQGPLQRFRLRQQPVAILQAACARYRRAAVSGGGPARWTGGALRWRDGGPAASEHPCAGLPPPLATALLVCECTLV